MAKKAKKSAKAPKTKTKRVNKEQETIGSREKILKAGSFLFATKGIKATTVRMICAEADVTINMVSHYFGGKDGLLDEIVFTFSSKLFASALRIIEEPAENKADFASRFKLFQAESLASAIEHREVIAVMHTSGVELSKAYPAATEAVRVYQSSMLAFLKSGVKAGAVRKVADVEMLTSLMWDRIVVQVRHLEGLEDMFGENIMNPEFRKRWLNANVDLFLNGVLA